MKFRSSLFAALASAAVLVLASCSSTTPEAPTEITGAKYVLLDPELALETPDPMINFERRQLMRGAVTKEEREDREGHYYVFWWKDSVRTPAIVRLEFRQESTGSMVKVREKVVDEVKRKNKTYFKVTGEEYQTDGRVTAWRVSVVRDGETVATDQSYLW